MIKRVLFIILFSLIISVPIIYIFIRDSKELISKEQKTLKMDDVQLKNYAQYNRWANEQFVEWLDNASEEQLNREVESSFKTILSTVTHLWGAEYGWLKAMKKEPWGKPYEGEVFNGSTDSLFIGFLQTSKNIEEYVSSLTTKEMNTTRGLGEDKTPTPLEDIILHVFNHATFHRGQIITIGRQVGLENPPRTDYIYYIRQKEANK